MAERRWFGTHAPRDLDVAGAPVTRAGGEPSGTELRRPYAALTRRILAALPGRAPLWVVAWALVPWLNLAAAAAIGDAAPDGSGVALAEVLNRAASTIAVLLSLWGAARITADLRTIRPALTAVVDQDETDVERLFRGIDSTLGPVLLTAAVALVLPLDELSRGDPAAAALQAVTWLVIGVPMCTAVWAYLVLQLGLSRLGAGHVTLQGYDGDRSLGLEPLGRLALTGFWMLFGTVAPLVVTGFADRPTQVVGIAVLVAAGLLVFLSLWRVHRRMAAVRQRELARARRLYQAAYRELRDRPSVEVLGRQAPLLKAAEDLERRAEGIRAWPFAEGTFTGIVAIASSVTAVIIARLLLATAGL